LDDIRNPLFGAGVGGVGDPIQQAHRQRRDFQTRGPADLLIRSPHRRVAQVIGTARLAETDLDTVQADFLGDGKRLWFLRVADRPIASADLERRALFPGTGQSLPPRRGGEDAEAGKGTCEVLSASDAVHDGCSLGVEDRPLPENRSLGIISYFARGGEALFQPPAHAGC